MADAPAEGKRRRKEERAAAHTEAPPAIPDSEMADARAEEKRRRRPERAAAVCIEAPPAIPDSEMADARAEEKRRRRAERAAAACSGEPPAIPDSADAWAEGKRRRKEERAAASNEAHPTGCSGGVEEPIGRKERRPKHRGSDATDAPLMVEEPSAKKEKRSKHRVTDATVDAPAAADAYVPVDDTAAHSDEPPPKRKKRRAEASDFEPVSAPSRPHDDEAATPAPRSGVPTADPTAAPKAPPTPKRPPTVHDDAVRMVFLGRCPTPLTDEALRAHFAPLGPDALTEVKWGTKYGEYLGYGLLTFATEALAMRAAEMDPPEAGGQRTRPWYKGRVPFDRAAAVRLLGEYRDRQALGGKGRRAKPTLTPIDWTTEPEVIFKKDLSHLLKPAERSKEEVVEWRNLYNMTVPRDAPPPVLKFTEVDLGDAVIHHLRTQFDQPSAIQAQGLPMVVRGMDVIGIAEPGSGKTLTFLLPAIAHIQANRRCLAGEGPRGVILAPTRELATQIGAEAETFRLLAGLRLALVHGGLQDREGALRIAEALMVGVDLVTATPGRLCQSVEARIVTLKSATFVVLDEADRMLDLGLRPQVEQLLGQAPPSRQTVMFSATWGHDVQALAEAHLRDPRKVVVNAADVLPGPSEVQHHLHLTSGVADKNARLVDILNTHRARPDSAGKALVFVNRCSAGFSVAAHLTRSGLKASALHAQLPQADREKIVRTMREGKTTLVVATDVAARGLDFPDLGLVVQYDMATTAEVFVHRAGRAAHGGLRDGACHTFFDPRHDPMRAKFLIRCLAHRKVAIPDELYALAETYELEALERNETEALSDGVDEEEEPENRGKGKGKGGEGAKGKGKGKGQGGGGSKGTGSGKGKGQGSGDTGGHGKGHGKGKGGKGAPDGG